MDRMRKAALVTDGLYLMTIVASIPVLKRRPELDADHPARRARSMAHQRGNRNTRRSTALRN